MYVENTPSMETFKTPSAGEAVRIPIGVGRSLLVGRLGTPDGKGVFIDLVTAKGDEYELATVEDADDALLTSVWKDPVRDYEATAEFELRHELLEADEADSGDND